MIPATAAPGFPQFPGFPPGFPFGGAPAQPQAVEAKGSGFIINPTGTIVTNNHVVKDAKTVSVTLSDGTSYPAKIIGTDPKTDLAVLKINVGHPLPYVEFAYSKDVEPGEWVVAMGNPFGLGGTVTAGIVSALGRNIGDGPYDRFIQIDAPINEGNSGGPLFDQRGQVIGINTAILTPSGGSVGIGFAIPSDMVKHVVTQLIDSGKVTRGYLGVAAQQISPQMAQAMGLPTADPTTDGALIAAVSADSPAARAGLKPGDVITAVNGTKVTDPSDLAADIANIDPGHDTSITYLQDGKTHNMSVAVTTMPADPNADFQDGGSGPAASDEPCGFGPDPGAADARQPQPAQPAEQRQRRGDRRGEPELARRPGRAAAGRSARGRRFDERDLTGRRGGGDRCGAQVGGTGRRPAHHPPGRGAVRRHRPEEERPRLKAKEEDYFL